MKWTDAEIDIVLHAHNRADAYLKIHTCCPPAPTGWDNGLSQDYNKELGAWFSEKPNAKEELRARTFDDYGNQIV